MEPNQPRSWQRGSSKTRGFSNSRLSQPVDNDIDPMMSTVQKSHIASILSGARSTVGASNNASELQRPFTPGDMPRHLFSGDDYQNRPGSSYKMKNIVGQAIDEFNSAVGVNQSMTTQASMGGQSSLQSNKRAGSQHMIQKMDGLAKVKPRGNMLPALEPIKKESLQMVGGKGLKGFDSNKPIKVVQNQKSDPSLNVSGMNISQQQQKPPTVVKTVKLKKPDASSAQIDFTLSEEAKYEEMMKFDQSKMDNMRHMQQLHSQLKQANQSRQEDDQDEDDYEDYFEKQMAKDLQGVESFEQPIDYQGVISKIQEKVKDIDQAAYEDAEDEEEYKLMQDEQEGYAAEYHEVINEMSSICSILGQNAKSTSKISKIDIDEQQILELCPRIYTLASEHGNQSMEIKNSCFLETLLKGTFSMLAVKHPRAVLRLASCNIQLFLTVFQGYNGSDFHKMYGYLFETMKILLIYAKEGSHDNLFKEEGLIPQIGRVLQVCFLDKASTIIRLTSQVVNKKEIINDDLVYDLVNYTIGSIKCFTQSNQQVQNESVKQRYIPLLNKCMQRARTFGSNMSKKAQMLVQISGALRNLANEEDSYNQMLSCGVIQEMIEVMEQFKGHKELMLNLSRILSKVSTHAKCSEAIINSKKLGMMVDQIFEFQSFGPFLVRIAFVLANITTYYEEAREQICLYQRGMERILSITITYLSKEDEKPTDSSSQLSNTEDSLIKMIRLIANLCTNDKYTVQQLHQNQKLVNSLVERIMYSIKKQHSDEFVFNAISCATNILFYDTPAAHILTSDLREQLFHGFKGYILMTSNEELQIEAVRVLSNLSRHQSLCEVYVSDKTFLEALCAVLDHTLRDLVFYAIGIVINITLHQTTRPKLLEKGVISKLIDVLKDSNIEDMEMAKVAAKALHNVASECNYWSIEQIKKLDEILSSLGEELDSIMEVANDEELEEIKGLRDMVNALINDMPEPMFDCPDQKCGRKFKNKDELDKHVERRHGQKQ